jgi:hypothetical protein
MSKDDIFNFAENPDDVPSMTSKEIDEYLKEEGIDTKE